MNLYARTIIETLVYRTEENPGRVRGAMQRVDESKIPPLDLDDFHHSMHEAEKIGGVTLEWGKREESHILQRIRLRDLDKACRALGIVTAADAARAATEQILSSLSINDTWIDTLVASLHDAWRRRKSAFSLDVGQAADAITAIRAVQAIKDGRHECLDMRTFSRRAIGDSKAVERTLGPIVAICRQEFDLQELGYDKVLEALGLLKFPQPVLVSGDLKLVHTGQSLSGIAPYIGLPPADDYPVRPNSRPAYVMTIENLTSFNRYVREIADNGLVIYTGGYPSHAVGRFISSMSQCIELEVPWFHWGDVDADGLLILDKVSELSGRPVTPHLMTAELALEKGAPATESKKLRRLIEGNHACKSLAVFLLSPDAHTLEQEELDPASPLIKNAIYGDSHAY